MTEVRIAEHAGFCFGVRRAIEMLEKAVARGTAKNRTVVMLGPIIHNPRLIEKYARNGVRIADSLAMPSDGIVVIRSHGIPASTEAHLQNIEDVDIVDTTCPFVKRIHRLVEKKSSDGYHIIVLGDKEHSEVDAFVSRIQDRYLVVSPEAVTSGNYARLEQFFRKSERLFLVAQTTSRPDVFESLVDTCCSLAGDNTEFVWENTVCDATYQRQMLASEMAEAADAMIVIGGRNSSNTAKLLEIARKRNPHSWHVESPVDITDKIVEKLKSADIIGITAGASTPDTQIEELRTFLAAL